MKRSRLILHEKLCKEVLKTRNCYFNPPASIQMEYPCIVYSYAAPSVEHADNKRYHNTSAYDLMVIDTDPESEISKSLFGSDFLYLSPGNPYVVDGLYHFPFTLYY